MSDESTQRGQQDANRFSFPKTQHPGQSADQYNDYNNAFNREKARQEEERRKNGG